MIKRYFSSRKLLDQYRKLGLDISTITWHKENHGKTVEELRKDGYYIEDSWTTTHKPRPLCKQ